MREIGIRSISSLSFFIVLVAVIEETFRVDVGFGQPLSPCGIFRFGQSAGQYRFSSDGRRFLSSERRKKFGVITRI